MYKLTPFSFSYKTGKKIFSTRSLEFSNNGLYLITGNSGSGKSTFLNLLKGISPQLIPGKLIGEIKFEGQNLTNSGEFENHNKVIYLFQNPFSQLIHKSLELEFAFTLENLNYPIDCYKKKKDEIGRLFEIDALWNCNTSILSNGECQKLVLASLIALGPKVILLDEPTAFLDPISRDNFYKLIDKIKKDHMIFLVDHHINEVFEKSDYILSVNENGELLEKAKNNFKVELIDNDKSVKFQKINDKIDLEIRNVSFNYRYGKALLENLNLKITNGEVVVIKGKNGAGKSTMFKLFTKILRPKKGQIDYRINGIIQNQKSIRRNVGFVFQNPESNFFFDTLKEEFEGGDPELIKVFFDESEMQRSPFLFSEGQKRRISILINLILGKKVIYYDEPTFGQDEKNKKLIANLILGLKASGLIQIIISHDQDFINMIATSIYEIKEKNLYEIK